MKFKSKLKGLCNFSICFWPKIFFWGSAEIFLYFWRRIRKKWKKNFWIVKTLPFFFLCFSVFKIFINRPWADAELQVLAMFPIAYWRTLAILPSRQNRYFISCIFTMLIWYLILILKCKLNFFSIFNSTIFIFNQHLCLFSLKLILEEWCLHVEADALSIFSVCLSKCQFLSCKFLIFSSLLVMFYVFNNVFWGMIRLKFILIHWRLKFYLKYSLT